MNLTSLVCEEYKQIQTEFDAARGEWIHFRLTASQRAAGITEGQSKEMLTRAKDKMEKAQDALLAHVLECRICNKTRDAVRDAS